MRNKIIVIKVLHGETYKNVGEQYGITGVRARAIVLREIHKLGGSRPKLSELRENKKHYLIRLTVLWWKQKAKIKPQWFDEWRRKNLSPRTTLQEYDEQLVKFLEQKMT